MLETANKKVFNKMKSETRLSLKREIDSVIAIKDVFWLKNEILM